MAAVELISFKNSSFGQSHSKELKLWPTVREDLLKTFSQPFILFLDYASLKKNFLKFNEIGQYKNLLSVVLTVDNEVFTYSWKEMESELKKSALKKIHTIDNKEAIKRLLHSWKIQAQDDLIADFKVAGEDFYLIGCNLKELKGSLKEFKVFKDIKDINKLSNFEIDEHGSFITWPELDIDLDLNSFRAKFEDGFKKKLQLKKLERMSLLGQKMQKLRKLKGLSQSDFKEVTAKTIGRYERGETSVSSKNLERIAKTLGFSVDEYIKEVNRVEL